MKKENAYLKWMAENTPTQYWHDSADLDEIEIAIANGAMGVTTNPLLVGKTIQNRDMWKDYLADIDKSLAGDDKVESIIKAVSLKIISMVPETDHDFVNGVCAQTNPLKSAQLDYMVKHADQYATWSDQIMIKLPATRAGIQAAEICASKGYNVAVTVSFTVPQVIEAGSAIQRGFEKARENGIKPGSGFAVLMTGRLDDYLRDVMLDTVNDASEEDIIWAGNACIKRAYNIFNERGYESIILTAGCRGTYHITEIAGGNIACSVSPSIYDALVDCDDFTEHINDSIDTSIIKRLQTIPEFVKAYEPDGLTTSEFMGYGATNRTLTQFIEVGWNSILNYSL